MCARCWRSRNFAARASRSPQDDEFDPRMRANQNTSVVRRHSATPWRFKQRLTQQSAEPHRLVATELKILVRKQIKRKPVRVRTHAVSASLKACGSIAAVRRGPRALKPQREKSFAPPQRPSRRSPRRLTPSGGPQGPPQFTAPRRGVKRAPARPVAARGTPRLPAATGYALRKIGPI